MAKKASGPAQEKPQEGQCDPIPLEAWDKFDGLLDKALGKKEVKMGQQEGGLDPL